MAAWNNRFQDKKYRGGPCKTSSRLLQQWVKKTRQKQATIWWCRISPISKAACVPSLTDWMGTYASKIPLMPSLLGTVGHTLIDNHHVKARVQCTQVSLMKIWLLNSDHSSPDEERSVSNSPWGICLTSKASLAHPGSPIWYTALLSIVPTRRKIGDNQTCWGAAKISRNKSIQ